MRRLAAASLVLLLMSGCSQVFDSNLFSSFDLPPPLDANAIKSMSPSSLENLINNDTSFMKSLKGNNAALDAVNDVLGPVYAGKSTAVGYNDSADTKTSVVNAAQAAVLANTFGTGASSIVSSAVSQANNLMSSSSVTTAVKALFSGKSQAEVESLLNTFQTINTAFLGMQYEAATSSSGPMDTSTFFGSGNKGDLSQIALVAGALAALQTTNGGNTTAFAAAIAGSGGLASAPASFNSALDGTATTSGNPYAYVYLAKSQISP